MTFAKMTPHPPRAPTAFTGDLITDYRARLALEQSEAIERRRIDLAEQLSELNTPEQRIRIWERLHALKLPRDSVHPLLRIIATRTGLTLQQIREEQQLRATTAVSTPTVPSAYQTGY